MLCALIPTTKVLMSNVAIDKRAAPRRAIELSGAQTSCLHLARSANLYVFFRFITSAFCLISSKRLSKHHPLSAALLDAEKEPLVEQILGVIDSCGNCSVTNVDRADFNRV